MPNKRTASDTRFQPIVDFYFAEFERRHGAKPLWDGSDGSALGRILFTQKQLTAEKLIGLVKRAFEWCDEWYGDGGRGGPVRKGVFCPLQPGFRFREFAAHFGKVICRGETGRGEKSFAPTATTVPAGRPTAQQITRVFREYGDRVVGARDTRAKWDEILQRTLGISYGEAYDILSREPVRPDRVGD